MVFRTPLLLGLQIDEVFGVVEAGVVGSIIWPTDLCDDLRDFGIGGEENASTVHDVCAISQSGARSAGAPQPDGSLVEVRQELGADARAGQQPGTAADCRHRHAYHHPAMLYSPCQGAPIPRGNPN